MKTIKKSDLIERLKIGFSGVIIFDCQLLPKIESEKCIFGICDECKGMKKDLNLDIQGSSQSFLNRISDSKNEVISLNDFNELKNLA